MSSNQNIFTFIDQLANTMKRHQLSHIEANNGTYSATLSRHTTSTAAPSTPETPADMTTSSTSDVLSPTLGTFYAKPSPDDKPFATIGAHVQKGQTLGLIESMKVFHPIHAPMSGTLTHIHILHGHSAEHHQLIMSIEPDAL